MAQLPNIDRAVVSDDKLTGYLLNHAHPRGAAKARFLASFGFAVERLAECAMPSSTMPAGMRLRPPVIRISGLYSRSTAPFRARMAAIRLSGRYGCSTAVRRPPD